LCHDNDFLSPEGAPWGLVGTSVTTNKTVERIEALFKTAKANGIPVFISPHYYNPSDHGWKFGGAQEVALHSENKQENLGPRTLSGDELENLFARFR
jgi:nicotinamidase-related amidase